MNEVLQRVHAGIAGSIVVAFGVVIACSSSACSGGSPAVATKGAGGGASGSASGGASGSATGGTSSAIGGSNGGGAGGGAGGGFANIGVCGRRGQATADATSFAGYEERYLIGEQGFGTDICVVRFDLTRVGDAPGGCSVCVWTHLLEYGKATVVTDSGGVCANSELGLGAAALTNIAGSRIAIGFAKQLGGAHGSARMTYDNTTSTWDVTGNATWNETSNAFKFDYREGICNYGS